MVRLGKLWRWGWEEDEDSWGWEERMMVMKTSVCCSQSVVVKLVITTGSCNWVTWCPNPFWKGACLPSSFLLNFILLFLASGVRTDQVTSIINKTPPVSKTCDKKAEPQKYKSIPALSLCPLTALISSKRYILPLIWAFRVSINSGRSKYSADSGSCLVDGDVCLIFSALVAFLRACVCVFLAV